MVTDATRKYRDIIAIGLVAVAALHFIGALTMLFTVGNGYADGTFDFADKAALTSGDFPSLVPMAAIVVAGLLVTRYGDVGQLSRIVILAGLCIVALDLLFGIITYLAQFGSGIGIAGPTNHVVRATFGLALLLLLALVCLYLVTALRSLPVATPAQAPQWGAPGQQGYASGWAQPEAAAGAGPPSWSQPAPTYGWPQQDPAQRAAWGAPAAGSAPASAGGWTDPAAGWHDPAAAQQGQPASAWSQAAQGSETSPPAEHEWAAPSAAPQWEQQQQQPTWAQPAGTTAGATQWTSPQQPGDTSADQAPADQAPADQAPTDQAPVDPAPVDPAPVDTALFEAAPASPSEQPNTTVDTADGEVSDGTAAGADGGSDDGGAERGGWWRRTER